MVTTAMRVFLLSRPVGLSGAVLGCLAPNRVARRS
jgi:hypothetical protein